MAGAKGGVDVSQIGPGEAEATDNPSAGKYRGDEVRCARGTVLQRMQDLSNGLLVVIGGSKGAGVAASSANLVGIEYGVVRRHRGVAPAFIGFVDGRLGNAF